MNIHVSKLQHFRDAGSSSTRAKGLVSPNLVAQEVALVTRLLVLIFSICKDTDD
jgi:hypothetical protein